MATPIVMPKQGNSVETCLIVEWKKAVGDLVAVGEVLCEIETDKAVMEVESPVAGILLSRLFEAGLEVPVMTNIAFVGEAGEVLEQLKAVSSIPKVEIDTEQVIQPRAVPSPISSANKSSGISPRARNLASQSQIELEALSGSGPASRVIEQDIVQALAQSRTKVPEKPRETLDLPAGNYQTIPVKGVRKIISERMLASLQNTAQLTLNTSADARSLLEWRKQLKANPDPEINGITLGDLIMFAVAKTLKSFPNLNAWMTTESIYQFESVHLGFAVDTARGLLVPVIQSAGKLSLRELSRRSKELAIQAQESRINPEDLQGGTFTVTNLGNLGIESFTPILNPPQVAILGVGKVDLKPVQTDSGVEFWPHLNLSLTINHQAVDGAPGARFLQALSQNLADFMRLLALA